MGYFKHIQWQHLLWRWFGGDGANALRFMKWCGVFVVLVALIPLYLGAQSGDGAPAGGANGEIVDGEQSGVVDSESTATDDKSTVADEGASADEVVADVSAATPAIVHVVPIHGEIDRAQVVLVRRSIEDAQAKGADYLVAEIDTFGGRVDAALQITTLLGALTDVRTLAYIPINSEGTGVSWSAGALIAMSTDAIYMSPGTSIGAATPVSQQTDGSVSASDEKTLSAIRTQMAALAEKNGYPQSVALAMVDRDIELFEVYDYDTLLGVATEDEYARLRNQSSDEQQYSKGSVVSPQGKLLTLTAGEMERYGVSSGSPNSYDELYAQLNVMPQQVVEKTENNNFDNVIAFLTSGVVVSLLVLIALVGIFLEINSPGFGVPGVVGILALLVVIGANFFLGRVESFEIILLLAGLMLLVIEIFLIPGFGVAGIGGLLLVGVALVLTQQGFVFPQIDWQWDIFNRNVLVTFGSLIAGLLVFFFSTPVLARKGPFSKLALHDELASGSGYTVQGSAVAETLVGQCGITITALRPTGKARIGNTVLNVESEGAFVDAQCAVEVQSVDSNRVVVRQQSDQSPLL